MMDEPKEVKKVSSETEFYDPFNARSNKSSFDNRVFEDPWSTKSTPPVAEEFRPSKEGDLGHGK